MVGSLLPIPENPPEEEESDDEEEEDTKEKEGDEGEEKGEKKEEDGEKEEEKKEEKEKKAKPARTTPITPEEYYTKISPFKSSDIDLCFYGLDQPEFHEKLEDVYQHLEKKVREAKGLPPKKKEEETKEKESGDKTEGEEEEKKEEEEKVVRIYQSSTNVIFTALFPFRHVQVTLT